MGGRGSVNVDVAVIVTKLEEFVKEQVELTVFFSTAAGYWLMSFCAKKKVLIFKAPIKKKFIAQLNVPYVAIGSRPAACSTLAAGRRDKFLVTDFFRGTMTFAVLRKHAVLHSAS